MFYEVPLGDPWRQTTKWKRRRKRRRKWNTVSWDRGVWSRLIKFRSRKNRKRMRKGFRPLRAFRFFN